MNTHSKNIVVGFLGMTKDFTGTNANRFKRWRPSLGVCGQEHFVVDEFILLHEQNNKKILDVLQQDILMISPNTQVIPYLIPTLKNPWDFEEMYTLLYDVITDLPIDNNANYYIHITTGTHVAQICWYLLIEANFISAKIIQASPPKKIFLTQPIKDSPVLDHAMLNVGSIDIVDLDLSKYSKIFQRFQEKKQNATHLLKSGIATKDAKFNRLIDEIEKVAMLAPVPLLIMGGTGTGKSQLASKIYELKQQNNQIKGKFIAVNCATLRGDMAMSALFGHAKGAFTGANAAREGLLQNAHQGLLFLDEIGELGLDEQAMLLKAIEEKSYYPVGSDSPVTSDFYLIAGTFKNLHEEVKKGTFREDLLARIHIWAFTLPSLKERPDDIAPNVEYELKRYQNEFQAAIRFEKEALNYYLEFAQSSEAIWRGNFRDLSASITRMGMMSDKGVITRACVDEEIVRLQWAWRPFIIQQDPLFEYNDSVRDVPMKNVNEIYEASKLNNNRNLRDTNEINWLALGIDIDQIDLFAKIQLELVIDICKSSKRISDAGRTLFSASRESRTSTNDGDRLRKYLAKYDLTFERIKEVL